jgi:hypothetical protein
MNSGRKRYFIRVTNIGIFNAMIAAAEKKEGVTFEAQRRAGYYEFATANMGLWREIYLYGQMLAQAQDEKIDGGELPA